MKITDRFILNCMRHYAIWALVTGIMYAAYHLQHLLPPSLFELIMVMGGCIFIIYYLSLVWLFLCLLGDFIQLGDDDFFKGKKEKYIND